MWKTVGNIIGGLAAGLTIFFAGYQWCAATRPSTPSIEKPPPPAKIAQTYEWQWAGERWYTRVQVEKDTLG